MSIKEILSHNKIAGIKSTEVDLSSMSSSSIGNLLQLIENLTDTLNAAGNGIGLAAPQIGVFKRVFVIMTEEEQQQEQDPTAITITTTRAYINPSWTIAKKQANNLTTEEKEISLEGCLSVKEGRHQQLFPISRYKEILASWTEISSLSPTTETSKQITIQHHQGIPLKGFPARVFMHEHEHLNGGNITETYKRQQQKNKK